MSSTITKKKTLVAVLVAVMMSLALAGTAFAAADSITIKSETGKNVAGHTYTAYQLFDGDYDQDSGQLRNIVWGNAVTDQTALLKAIKDCDGAFKDVTDAADVAFVLGGAFGDTAANVEKFADAVKPYLDANGITQTAGENDSEVVFEGVEQGYYFIYDITKPEAMPKGDTATDYMLQVVGDAEVVVKSGSTESDKFVDEDSTSDTELEKYADQEIGKTVKFTITSTIPANIASYKRYWVELQDTMSPGLTLVEDSIKVSGVNNTAIKEKTYGSTTSTDSKYAGGTDIKVRIEAGEGCAAPITALRAGQTITVTYEATLNKDAIKGIEGNPNKFKTVYNTDPNDDGDGTPGETPETEVVVYTWQLDSTKIDGMDESKKLEGARFVLKDAEGNFAQFEEPAGPLYILKAWGSEVDATPIVSPAEGLFEIRGLDSADEYFLVETQAPDGYNLLADPIKIVIDAHKDANGEPQDLTATITNGGEDKQAEGNLSTGIVSQNIVNVSGSTLPSTGGMGTVIFTVVGVAVMVIAVAVFVTRRRRSNVAAV